MKRILSILLACSLALSLAACGAPAPKTTPTPTPTAAAGRFTPGTYEGSAEGNNGPIVLNVTVDENAITAIDVVSHVETEGICNLAFERVPAAILADQSLAVDTVAGATMSSKGIIAAVTAALESSGADLTDLLTAKAGSEKKGEEIAKTADVVIIGGGGAGLAAAASAAENGASVIVLEKMPSLGGNTVISGGGYNAVDPKRQKPLGIEDSLENHFNQTMKGGDNKANPDLVHVLVDNAYPTLEWLESKGMQFKDTVQTITGGLFDRGHTCVEPLGTGYINALSADATKNGAEIIMEAKATELITDGGRVTGVKAECVNGDTLTLTANKGVIIASGGFGANVELREKVNTMWPSLGANIPTTNSPAITGDGLFLAESVGANLINLEDIQLLPLGDPNNGSLKGKIGKIPSDFIFVNKEGKRFVAEDARRDVMSKGLLEQTDAYMYIIDDGDSYPTADTNTNFDVTVGDMVAQGTVFMADTVEDLAKQIGIDPATLAATLEEYNKCVDAKEDKVTGKKTFTNKIDKAPYYACPRVPTVHHTMGGIEINVNTEVLDKNGAAIPGLYAAGEVTGGIHGTNRLGGNAIADAMVFGRIAGKTVAGK